VYSSLVEVTNTRAFSIIFGIAFLGLGAALAWRCWRAQAERLKVALMGGFAVLVCFSFLLYAKQTKRCLLFFFNRNFFMVVTQVVASGFACFFVTKDWLVTLSAAEKTPL
jgi:hypothetical protein